MPSAPPDGDPRRGRGGLAGMLPFDLDPSEASSPRRARPPGGGPAWALHRHEAARLVSLALPLVGSSLASFAVNLVIVAFIGRLDKVALSTAILATSLFNVTGLSLLIGSVGALETLAGQAFGAGDLPAVGLALQRALILTGLQGLAVAALLWTHMERLLLLGGQDAALSAGAARFLHLSAPALLLSGLAECLKRYLMVQGVVAPATWSALAALAVAPPACWLLIFRLGLGLDGAALAVVASQAAPLAVLLLYCRRRAAAEAAAGRERAWRGWSRDALLGWGQYLRLSAPSTAMVCLEWWAFEVCVLAAGWLPNPQVGVAAMGLTLNVSGALYMIPMGLSQATSVRVSNALGAGEPAAAARAARAALGLVVALEAALAAAVLGARRALPAAFTTDADVAAAAAAALPLLAATLVGDGVSAAGGGFLRGAGRQELGAMLYAGSYWGLGLPLAGALAFGPLRLGVRGLWGGLATSASCNAAVMVALLRRMDWPREAKRAQAALAAGGGGEGAALLLDSKPSAPSPNTVVVHGSGAGSSSSDT